MWRRPVLQGTEEKPEFVVRLFRIHSQGLEDPLLNVRSVDSNTPPSQFLSIHHQVVGTGAKVQQVASIFRVEVEPVRHGERVMLGTHLPVLELKQGKVRDPDRTGPVHGDPAESSGHMESKPAEDLVDHGAVRIGHHHDHVALPGAEQVGQAIQLSGMEELGDIALEFAVDPFHPGHALAAEGRDPLQGVLVLQDVFAQS